ncbi:MAG: outer membrane protein assembly factor BamB [Gammaproteobacteria bacterium]|nr:outer membrane protein assembly factor BamB [Gammaproteobacteria bacterium]
MARQPTDARLQMLSPTAPVSVDNAPGSRRLLLGGLAAVLVIGAVPGCSWFGADEIDESTPAELVDFEPSQRVRKVWKSGIGDGNETLRLGLAPASDGTRIFAADHDGRVAAFDAARGKRIWRVKTRLPLAGGPGYGNGQVVVGSSDGAVVSLLAENGSEQWRADVGSEVLAAPAVGRHVYVRTVDGKLVALNLSDGTQVWFVQQTMPRLSVRGTGSPVVDRNLVICGFDNGRVAAFDADDGSVVWDVLVTPPAGRTEVERMSDMNANVLVLGEEVFAVGYQGRLAALARESGQILWSLEFSSYSGLGADLANLYVSGEDGTLLAVERSTARERWRHDLLRNRDLTAPAAYGSSVVVGDFEGYLHFFEATTGTLQARVRVDSSRITAPPLVVNDLVYVMSDGGKLAAYRNVTPSQEN